MTERRTRAPRPVQEAPQSTVAPTRRVRTQTIPQEPTEAPTVVRRVRTVAQPNPVLAGSLELLLANSLPLEVPETKTATSQSSRVDYDRIISDYCAKATTPKNAIRAKCVECMGGMIAEVNRCTSTGCPLHPFRLGANPYHKLSKHYKDNGDGTEE